MKTPSRSNAHVSAADADSPRVAAGFDGMKLAPQPSANFRLGLVSVLAAVIGLIAGVIAFLLYNLIGLFSNIAFYHRFSTQFGGDRFNHLGIWVIFVPCHWRHHRRIHGEVWQ